MKILDAGHYYELESLDGECTQTVRFVKREGDNFPFNKGNCSGTNCQELLRVLIDRSEYLWRQKPCAETELIVWCLKTALYLFESRAARRHGRHLSLESVASLICGPLCKTCGHFGCEQHNATFTQSNPA